MEKVVEKDLTKRTKGQYYTLGNPFSLAPFIEWANSIGLSSRKILEPFAGANHIIRSLQSIGLCNHSDSFDIAPADVGVVQQNTIVSFPKGYDVCITNPPWLAKNSATRLKLSFPDSPYDDLYKHCLCLCLQHCNYVAALIPASYLHSNLFRRRLSRYILLHSESIFNDTDNPVCLALFDKDDVEDTCIYYDNKFIGNLSSLETHLPIPWKECKITFNDPLGKLGLVTFDNIREPSIKFCNVEEIHHYPVKHSSRYFVRIECGIENIPAAVSTLNGKINTFRNETCDLFLTPFKGIRKDGFYRRRMSFELAKRFIGSVVDSEARLLW